MFWPPVFPTENKVKLITFRTFYLQRNYTSSTENTSSIFALKWDAFKLTKTHINKIIYFPTQQ